MIKILFKKESKYPVDALEIKRKLKEFLIGEGISSDVLIFVSIVGERTMRFLSNKFLKSKEVHDVLSFAFLENGFEFVYPADGFVYLGEVVVCFPKALHQANSENKLLDEKIYELVKHGVIHLLGKHHD